MSKEGTGATYPEVSWFQERTDSFRECWDESRWHENGDRSLKPLTQSIRSYASHLNKLPENFLPSVFDQHLAVLREGYEYQVMDIVEDVGEGRYLCRNEAGEEFCLWSRALTLSCSGGCASLMTAIIRLAGDTGVPVPAITYGPVFTWKSLHAGDFVLIGSALARDLFRLKGLPGLIKRDPVPFWALCTLGEIPRIMHGSEAMCTCWYEGTFTGDPSPLLKSSWKRTGIGKRIRFHKSGSKPFFEQDVIYDTKSMKGIILARRGSYLEKLQVALSPVFTPDSEHRVFVSMTLEMAFSDILKKKLEYRSWTHAFDEQDERIKEEQKKQNPERGEDLKLMNDALKELIPYINSGTEPDWSFLAARHSFSPDKIELLKSLYHKYSRNK